MIDSRQLSITFLKQISSLSHHRNILRKQNRAVYVVSDVFLAVLTESLPISMLRGGAAIEGAKLW